LIRIELDLYPELNEFKGQFAQLLGRLQLLEARISKASSTIINARQVVTNKDFVEYEAVRSEIAAMLRLAIEGAGKKTEELFDTICKSGDRISKDDIQEFLSGHKCEIARDKLDKLFARAVVDEEGTKDADSIGRTDFTRMVRVYYKVVKDIVLSDNLEIKESKQVRKMDVGEVVEVAQGPAMDKAVGIFRVRGRLLKDGAEGWVTIAGNQGVTFLSPGGNAFKVVKSFSLTEELEDVEGEKKVKELYEGEIVEVLEWERTSGSPAVTRIKGKVQGDKKSGWATISDASGSVFLEAV